MPSEKTYLVLKSLDGNKPMEFGAIQTVLEPHVDTIAFIWWIIWIGTLIVVVMHIAREYHARRQQ